MSNGSWADRPGASSVWAQAQKMLRCWSARIPVRWQRPVRQLKVHEKLFLGEKSFVALVGYRERRFLLAANANSLAMLGEVSPARAFADLLAQVQPEGVAR